MFKDSSTQSYLWSIITSILAWFSDHQNLMILSLALGVVTSVVNLYNRNEERKIKQREQQRAEELHAIKMARLKQGLEDETH
ncbi:holin family HP1 protein [Volucribacter psittacicida]|uniref:Holin family HP1 protein n=1 Tax=Volucribacter psittacicida TaxID=203482 RepID=A0A4R1FYG6_9PAST|nr:HP1 family phage holin [Volucribacter psittacicida]TCJ98829.1 holin family HP1 protein [Volucribacter psittacicida]